MNNSKDISLIQSKNLNDYSDILKEFVNLFGKEFEKDIKAWCNNEKGYMPGFWKVYLIRLHNNKTVGITGLYSLNSDKNDELWLGWFGVQQKYRRNGFGGNALDKTFEIAKDKGAKKLFVYTWPDNKAIKLFEKKRFVKNGKVKDIIVQKNLYKKYFGSLNDIVLQKMVTDLF